jgi:flagellar biosynthesis/type III secretory pathway chaperone
MQQKERLRWHILNADLGINRQDAPRATLSELLGTMQDYEQEMYGSIRNELATLLARLQQLNNTNRLLAQRARNSTSHILDFMRDNVSICNVKI